MRRAYGSQAIEIATRLSDVTCVTEPSELRATPTRLDSPCIHFVFCWRMRTLGVADGSPRGARRG